MKLSPLCSNKAYNSSTNRLYDIILIQDKRSDIDSGLPLSITSHRRYVRVLVQ